MSKVGDVFLAAAHHDQCWAGADARTRVTSRSAAPSGVNMMTAADDSGWPLPPPGVAPVQENYGDLGDYNIGFVEGFFSGALDTLVYMPPGGPRADPPTIDVEPAPGFNLDREPQAENAAKDALEQARQANDRGDFLGCDEAIRTAIGLASGHISAVPSTKPASGKAGDASAAQTPEPQARWAQAPQLPHAVQTRIDRPLPSLITASAIVRDADDAVAGEVLTGGFGVVNKPVASILRPHVHVIEAAATGVVTVAPDGDSVTAEVVDVQLVPQRGPASRAALPAGHLLPAQGQASQTPDNSSAFAILRPASLVAGANSPASADRSLGECATIVWHRLQQKPLETATALAFGFGTAAAAVFMGRGASVQPAPVPNLFAGGAVGMLNVARSGPF